MRSRDMHNDVDDRDGRYDEPGARGRRHEPDDRRRVYDDDGRGQYDDRGEYDEPQAAPARYDEPYEDFDDPTEIYQETEPRRSRLVPILTIVASLLAVAIAVVVVLYAIGMFDSDTTSLSGESTPIELTPDNVDPVTPDMRDVTETAPPGATTADVVADVAAPDVRDAAVSIAPPAQGEPPVRSAHGDWQVRCDTPAGAQSEQCVLMQFVTAEDRDNVGLTVIVLRTADGQARIMRILAPLGVLLPSGLGLKIDDADVGRAGFVRCLPNGCVAEVILEDTLLGQLQAGATATFIIFQTPEEGIGIPISLAGFGEGFQALP